MPVQPAIPAIWVFINLQRGLKHVSCVLLDQKEHQLGLQSVANALRERLETELVSVDVMIVRKGLVNHKMLNGIAQLVRQDTFPRQSVYPVAPFVLLVNSLIPLVPRNATSAHSVSIKFPRTAPPVLPALLGTLLTLKVCQNVRLVPWDTSLMQLDSRAAILAAQGFINLRKEMTLAFLVTLEALPNFRTKPSVLPVTLVSLLMALV